MNPPSKKSPMIFLALGVLILSAGLAIFSGCECHRNDPKTNPIHGKPLEERKSALENEIQDRLQEIDRAVQRMQGRADSVDEAMRPKWKSALDQLQEGETTAAKRVDSLKEIEEGHWEEFQRDTHRALDELDLLREDAEAYFKEKS